MRFGEHDYSDEHTIWHTRMWDRGARMFFTGSNNIIVAYREGKIIGAFFLTGNKELPVTQE